MKRKFKRKPLRGARKFRVGELPWKTIIKVSSAVIMAGIFIFQFFTLKYHEKRSSQTLMDNLQLNEKVSTLTHDLSEERVSFETFITDQLERNVELESTLTETNDVLTDIRDENTLLLDELAAARLQNDVLRNKLNTMLGNASRNGEELSPSPMGPSGLSVKDLQKLTKGTNLAGIEEALLQIEDEHNVNALYALAVAKLETGSGTSFLCNEYNNLFGMRGKDWYRYETKNDSVLAFGELMVRNYFSKGFVTLERIGPRYAEGSNTWAIKAKFHMLRDMRKLNG
ncbi:MAG: glucosaminidase domain-containing protein [Saccharofermentanales bacterium]